MVKFAGTSLGLLAVGVAGIGGVARYLDVSNHALLIAAALAPYLMLAAPVALLAFLLTRQWILAGGTAILTVALLSTQASLFLRNAQPGIDGATLRVLTANIYLGEADPHQLTELATERADIVAVQELTADAVANLHAAGLDQVFPYHVLAPRPGASGTGLWSRLPITGSTSLPGHDHSIVVAHIRVPHVAGDQTVFAAHLPGPYPAPVDQWNRELGALPHELREAAGSGCVVVAGDFNSTLDMRAFRRLLDGGYRDAADQTGAGITATYPADHAYVPPLVAIDHVLTQRCTATSVDVVELPGSDHRGLVVNITIPAST